MKESSQDMSDNSSGTAMPFTLATPRPANAHHVIVVDDGGRTLSETQQAIGGLRPDSGV